MQTQLTFWDQAINDVRTCAFEYPKQSKVQDRRNGEWRTCSWATKRGASRLCWASGRWCDLVGCWWEKIQRDEVAEFYFILLFALDFAKWHFFLVLLRLSWFTISCKHLVFRIQLYVSSTQKPIRQRYLKFVTARPCFEWRKTNVTADQSLFPYMDNNVANIEPLNL